MSTKQRMKKKKNRKQRAQAMQALASTYVAKQPASAGAAAADIPMEDDDGLDEVEDVPDSVWIALAYILLGLVGLPLGAHFTISGATSIATSWGVSEAVIGLTVIALGTSLPELATTVMAAIRQHGAVAIGNVIGSNIFNVAAVLGVTSSLHPIAIPEGLIQREMAAVVALSMLLLPVLRSGWRIRRWEGAVLLTAYVGAFMFLL
mgnify:CR=1 FL=1